jgi:CheY-like chemotaxis protein
LNSNDKPVGILRAKLVAQDWEISVKVSLDNKMRKGFKSGGDSSTEKGSGLDLARVLLVHGELGPRLALRTILQAGGYAVDVAATGAEALTKLDEGRYELVLTDAVEGSRDVLAYARIKDYRPATAMITSNEPWSKRAARKRQISVYTENLPSFLEEIAELIGLRASRRYRPLRQAV